MKSSRPLLAALLFLLPAGCGLVKHVPPGQSLSVAMAKRPEVVAIPTPKPAPIVESGRSNLPLPDPESVSDAFTLGNLCMQQGHYADAVTAYRKAVAADPNFSDAWNGLALAYESLGQNDKAMEAFRKYKMIAQH